MNNNKISVIVPIYNVEEYLEACINSIVLQSYDNIEVLLIDDGSTDRSAFICDKFAKEYSFIRVHHQLNQGVSVARNTGIELATAKWITFVDGDDMLCKDALKNCSNELDHSVDYYIFNTLRENKHKEVSYSYPVDIKFKNKTFESKELFRKYNFTRGVVWGAIYNMDFINKHNLRFIKGIKNSQDTIFSLFAQHFANKIHFSNIDLCYVKYREGSASRSWAKGRVIKYVENLVAIENDVNKYNIDYNSSPIIRMLYYIMVSNIVKQAVVLNETHIYDTIKETLKMSSLYPINLNSIRTPYSKICILNISIDLYIWLNKLLMHKTGIQKN